MTKNVKKGAGIVLIFLFFSCETTINGPIDSENNFYSVRYNEWV
jgi:hypothetical protein